MLDGERGNLSLRPSNQMKRNSRPTHIAGGSLRVYRENDANAANGVASAVGGAVSLEETPYPRARTTSNWRARCSVSGKEILELVGTTAAVQLSKCLSSLVFCVRQDSQQQNIWRESTSAGRVHVAAKARVVQAAPGGEGARVASSWLTHATIGVVLFGYFVF